MVLAVALGADNPSQPVAKPVAPSGGESAAIRPIRPADEKAIRDAIEQFGKAYNAADAQAAAKLFVADRGNRR